MSGSNFLIKDGDNCYHHVENEKVADLGYEAAKEAVRAMHVYPTPYNSLHEAYGVLAEEVDEFWELVKMKQADRDPKLVREELIQIAAVALRTLHDLEIGDFLRR